ncbi:TPA_asm: P [Corylus betacytorhabdovirus 1]|nr:TPA_asm: P [Corylus betacytorhabdovirus 1]
MANFAPIDGTIADKESYLTHLMEDFHMDEPQFNAPIPTPEEAEQERKEARAAVTAMIVHNSESIKTGEIAPVSGDEMKDYTKTESEAKSEKPQAAKTKKDKEKGSAAKRDFVPTTPPYPPPGWDSKKEDEKAATEKRMEQLLDAFHANLTPEETEAEMECDDEEEENIHMFLESQNEFEVSPGSGSVGTKGSASAVYVDGLVANQGDHASWLAYLAMLFEAEGLLFHPDHQNELEHIFHDYGLTERDVKMYCSGIKRERSLSVMKQLDGLVERMTTCLSTASSLKTSLSKAVGKQEELVERLFDGMRSSPEVSSASVGSPEEPTKEKEKPVTPIMSHTWVPTKTPNKWAKPVTDKDHQIKNQQSRPTKASGSIVIREPGTQQQKQPEKVWRRTDQQKNKGKLTEENTLTSEQKQMMDLVGVPAEIYTSKKFLPYVRAKLDPQLISEMKTLDVEKYSTFKEVFMRTILNEWIADHPDQGP